MDVPAVTWKELEGAPAESSAEVRARVVRARGSDRAPGAPGRSARALLRHAVDSGTLSARGFHRTLRIATTIARLEGADRVEEELVAEALAYRRPGPEAP